jgi:hypothetical protein
MKVASFELSINDSTSKLATFIHTHLKACHFHSYSPQSLLLSLMLNSKLATIIDAQLKACHFHSYSTQSLPLSELSINDRSKL